MRRTLIYSALLALPLLAATTASSQDLSALKTGATLTGVVLSPEGRPVAKASVSCQSAGGVAPHAVFTDAKGHFAVNGLKQDSYDLRAYFNGTYSDWVRNVRAAGGEAFIKRGRSRRVKLIEIPPEERAPIIKAWCQIATSGRRHLPIAHDAPVSAFEAIAADHPVFRIDPAVDREGKDVDGGP